MQDQNVVKAGLIIIGNEILSGRTQDTNLNYLAHFLEDRGIRLHSVLVVRDEPDEIALAINAFKIKYDYVFTTGGIGPTHDDITTESIAKALGRKLEARQEVVDAMAKYYGGLEHVNEGRMKMCIVPEGAELIHTDITIAPGFKIENIFVMAGIPNIMQAMLHSLDPFLKKRGAKIITRTLFCDVKESEIVTILDNAQNAFIQDVEIGSYPQKDGNHFYVNVVLRSTKAEKIEQVQVRLLSDFASADILAKVV